MFLSHSPINTCEHVSEYMCLYVYVLLCVSACVAYQNPSLKHILLKAPFILIWHYFILRSAVSPSLLLNATICQPSSFIFSSLHLPLIPPFLSLPTFSVLHFPAHPIWSLTPHSCSSFNEHLSPSHAHTCTHCSNTSHTELPSKCLSVHAW